jgi:hypothetical protein
MIRNEIRHIRTRTPLEQGGRAFDRAAQLSRPAGRSYSKRDPLELRLKIGLERRSINVALVPGSRCLKHLSNLGVSSGSTTRHRAQSSLLSEYEEEFRRRSAMNNPSVVHETGREQRTQFIYVLAQLRQILARIVSSKILNLNEQEPSSRSRLLFPTREHEINCWSRAAPYRARKLMLLTTMPLTAFRDLLDVLVKQMLVVVTPSPARLIIREPPGHAVDKSPHQALL